LFWQHRFLALPDFEPMRLPEAGRGGIPQLGLKHGCLRLTPEGDSGAACDVIEAAGWSGGQRAWELPTRLICGNAQLVRLLTA
jgi:hypothetical protein